MIPNQSNALLLLKLFVCVQTRSNEYFVFKSHTEFYYRLISL